MNKVFCPWCGNEMRFCIDGGNIFMVCAKCFARSPSVTAERDEDGFLLEILPEKVVEAAHISHAQKPLTLEEACGSEEPCVYLEKKTGASLPHVLRLMKRLCFTCIQGVKMCARFQLLPSTNCLKNRNITRLGAAGRRNPATRKERRRSGMNEEVKKVIENLSRCSINDSDTVIDAIGLIENLSAENEALRNNLTQRKDCKNCAHSGCGKHRCKLDQTKYGTDYVCRMFVRGDAADMIGRLSKENKRLHYTLQSVMHFVDKWIYGEPYYDVDDPDGKIAVNRAAEAREIALKAIEIVERERNASIEDYEKLKRERDAAVHDLNVIQSCLNCVHSLGDACAKGNCSYTDSKWEWRGIVSENSGGDEECCVD